MKQKSKCHEVDAPCKAKKQNNTLCFEKLPIKDASLVRCPRYHDHRGFFQEIFNFGKYGDDMKGHDWKQLSWSRSLKAGILRGLHCSKYGKLVTCVRGSVYDVMVDLREDSPTFLRWCGVVLDEHNRKQVFVPANCAHGFFTLEDDCDVVYAQEGTFNPPDEQDMLWSDPLMGVKWPTLASGEGPILSAKDKIAPTVYDRRPHLKVRNLQPRRRILVIGASGQVGSALVEEYGPWNCVGTFCSTPVAGMVKFDLIEAAETAEALMQMVKPECVFICAGWTSVDSCEGDPSRAHAVNTAGPAAVARAAAAAGAKTVYFSTEYVFDGREGPYAETDSATPLSVYGRSKLEGERAVMRADPDALILRTTVVYGPDPQGKNCVYQYARKFAAGGGGYNVPTDQVTTPTYSRDLASASQLLVAAGAKGVFNVVGPEVTSRHGFAELVVAELNLDSSKLRPITTAALKQVAGRPLSAGLKIDKVKQLLRTTWSPRTAKQAIAHWLANPRGMKLGN